MTLPTILLLCVFSLAVTIFVGSVLREFSQPEWFVPVVDPADATAQEDAEAAL